MVPAADEVAGHVGGGGRGDGACAAAGEQPRDVPVLRGGGAGAAVAARFTAAGGRGGVGERIGWSGKRRCPLPSWEGAAWLDELEDDWRLAEGEDVVVVVVEEWPEVPGVVPHVVRVTEEMVVGAEDSDDLAVIEEVEIEGAEKVGVDVDVRQEQTGDAEADDAAFDLNGGVEVAEVV